MSVASDDSSSGMSVFSFRVDSFSTIPLHVIILSTTCCWLFPFFHLTLPLYFCLFHWRFDLCWLFNFQYSFSKLYFKHSFSTKCTTCHFKCMYACNCSVQAKIKTTSSLCNALFFTNTHIRIVAMLWILNFLSKAYFFFLIFFRVFQCICSRTVATYSNLIFFMFRIS